jgi:pimeloyl-ACP methyl ester carboxylesterase
MMPARSSNRRLAVSLVVTTVSALTLSACFPLSLLSQVQGETSVPFTQGAPVGFESYYAQPVEWSFCWVDVQCGTLQAPTDWSDPLSAPIELALTRHVASTQPAAGDLFVNPGGPGESAATFISDSADRAVDAKLLEAYNIVGIDPRGVGGSTPVRCFIDSADMDNALYSIPKAKRNSIAWNDEARQRSQEFGAACLENTGDLLGFVDTESAARDMDMVRAALGNETLNYLGYSYGTFLGAMYADLFPDRVGKMVLDGAVDPTATVDATADDQTIAFESALNAFLAWCVDGGNCPLGDSVPEATGSMILLLSGVDAQPLVNADGRLLGADTLVTAIANTLYDDSAWSYLSDLLGAALNGDPSIAFESADTYNGRGPDGSYASNTTEAFVAVNCIDVPADTPADIADSTSATAEVTGPDEQTLLRAPILGPYLFSPVDICSVWPVSPRGSSRPLVADGAPDLLVIGTTNDPATPYADAISLSEQMSSAHLVTFKGEGHTAYNRGNSCIDDIVDRYFLDGAIPPADVVCS